jgi:hypothetical protein
VSVSFLNMCEDRKKGKPRHPGISDPVSCQSRPKVLEVLYFVTTGTRKSSSTLFHNPLLSGTQNETDSSGHCVRHSVKKHHLRVGLNLSMAWTDLLVGVTDPRQRI